MTEEEWLQSENSELLINYLLLTHRPGFLKGRSVRLFFCACCRRFWDTFCNDEVRTVIELAEAFADKSIKCDELVEKRRSLKAGVKLTNSHESPADFSAFSLSDPGPVRTHWLFFLTRRAASRQGRIDESARQADLLRDIFGNPFRPVALDHRWLTSTVLDLATAIYAERAFERLPILADALMDAGCDSEEVIAHCRSDGTHARGCWVVDLLLGKE
jgi:hypothetical protein